jgi:hypothetical protein
MTVTFENDNDVIVYALEKIILHARRTQQIFVAQCVWWLVSIIGLEEALVNYIDKLHGRTTVQEEYTNKADSDPVVQTTPEFQDSEVQESKEDRQDQILAECEEYLKDSRRLRDIASLKATGKTPTGCIHPTTISKKQLRKKDRYKRKLVKIPRKDRPELAGIDEAEIRRRGNSDECLRCAWPYNRKGSHRYSDCRRPIKLDQGTASFAKKYQGRLQEEVSEIEISSEESSDESL